MRTATMLNTRSFLYKEDFNKFMEAFTATVNYVKSDLMPEYDFDEYTRQNEED